MPKVVYTAKQGLFQELGEGIELGGKITVQLDNATDSVEALDVTRNITFRTSPTTGVSELSGSLLILRGRDESMFFHLGGDQYITSNAWYNGDTGQWVFATGSGNHSAFRWGFRGKGRFDLESADSGTEGNNITWTTSLAITSSNGYVGVGKKSPDSHGIGSFNAQLDVSGSYTAMALAVTGSVDLGGAAEDATFILPRVNNAQRDALPAMTGSLVYNSQTNKLNFYSDSGWKAVTDESV